MSEREDTFLSLGDREWHGRPARLMMWLIGSAVVGLIFGMGFVAGLAF